jgi:rhodanese-related sulfurtransferase/DNA-binding transcriptional ArsR family regulator
MTRKRQFKNNLYEQFSRLGKALSSPRRLEILDLLTQGPRTVESVALQTDQTLPNASQHLLALKAAGLLQSTKVGLHVTYSLAGPNVASFLLAFRKLAEAQIAEIERLSATFFAESPEPVDVEELSRHLSRGDVVLLDVRPREEYESGHLPGALSVPIRDLESELGRLPRRKHIVAYCRGPYCAYAHEAVKLLRKRGFKADRLEEGVVEWRALGLAVEA